MPYSIVVQIQFIDLQRFDLIGNLSYLIGRQVEQLQVRELENGIGNACQLIMRENQLSQAAQAGE